MTPPGMYRDADDRGRCGNFEGRAESERAA